MAPRSGRHAVLLYLWTRESRDIGRWRLHGPTRALSDSVLARFSVGAHTESASEIENAGGMIVSAFIDADGITATVLPPTARAS